MIQNLIALLIVFSAVGYVIFSIIKNLTAKKTSKCGGCSDCSFHETGEEKPLKVLHAENYTPHNLMLIKHGK